ncbi:PIR protein [Plasmodium ovale]|uniref:PIR Superfamily Protein n=2 Tax=Plasmodium ovale TaxID=36330 RepID=A0A1A8XBK8_PLAOA|nr:PIR Superfamily Protein [Plasmodium ovale curtisi]SBT85011.1 PIR protein [Plasmodium ovale]
MEDQYDFKPILVSTKLYNYLDEYSESDDHTPKCKEILSKFTGYGDIYKFCMALRSNLYFFNSWINVSISEKNQCHYLNSWINNRLINLNFSSEHEKQKEISDLISEYIKEFKIDKKCTHIQFSLINKDDYAKMKTLYDYALDSAKILHYAKKFGCTQENKNYIDNIHSIYTQVKRDCNEIDTKPYCVTWKYIKDNYTDKEMSELACKTIYNDPSEIKLGTDQADIDIPESSSEGRNPFGKDAEGGASPTTSSSTVVATLLPLLGLILILFILYRFTPLKSLVRHYLIKKRIIRSSTHDDDESQNDLFENTYAYMNKNIDRIRHQIGFQPL